METIIKLGPLAKLDKALGYEPGDSDRVLAVHQNYNVRLAFKSIITKIGYIFFYNCFNNLLILTYVL